MQTFLTFPSFSLTAQSLDNKRLGKQRVEAYQILHANLKEKQFREDTKDDFLIPFPRIAWRSHPAVLMWRHYEHLLAIYGMKMCLEWKARGYVDNLYPKFGAILSSCPFVIPSWITDTKQLESVITSHRYSLVQKLPEHYAPLFPEVRQDTFIPYFWPKYSRPTHYFREG